MAAFEEIFGIPREHTLKQSDFRCRGGDDYWEHHEYDARGKLIARYESWHRFKAASGWRKLSLDGTIIAHGEDLPL